MRLVRWLIVKLFFPLLISISIAVLVAFVLSKMLNIQNPVLNILVNRPYNITLAGTGSMHPTLYWDKKEGGTEEYDQALKENPQRVKPPMYFHTIIKNQYLNFEYPRVGFRDLVSFTQEGFEDSYIKRVIGLPNDKIELRDGYVIRNGQKLEEVYTKKARSTFGGTHIPECKEVTVPEDELFVLGDNRKLSLDSRFEIGFINIKNVDFVLPYDKQTNLNSTWREKDDHTLDNKPSLNVSDFVSQVNSLRKEYSKEPFNIDSRLNSSSLKRAEGLLNNSDSSDFSAAMTSAGYENALVAEYSLYGYYDAEELMALRVESKDLNDLILGDSYDDIGISVINKNVNGCPTQLTVLHFGGYIPAKYDVEVINSWKAAAAKTIESSRSWKEARGNDLYDQDKLEELLRKYEIVIEISNSIYAKISRSEWLSSLDEARIIEYEETIQEINVLSDQISNGANDEATEIRRENYNKCVANWQLYFEKKEECNKFL